MSQFFDPLLVADASQVMKRQAGDRHDWSAIEGGEEAFDQKDEEQPDIASPGNGSTCGQRNPPRPSVAI